MIILFPLVMTVAFGASFGAVGGTSSPSYSVGVVDLGSEGNASLSQQFSQALAATGVLKVHGYSTNASAQSDLSQGKLQGSSSCPHRSTRASNRSRRTPVTPLNGSTARSSST